MSTIRCLDGIPDISVLLNSDNEDPTASATICPAAPEPAPKWSKLSLNRKRGSEPSIITAVSEPLKDKTNTRFTIPVTSPERTKAAKGVIQKGVIRCVVKLLDTYLSLLPPGSPVFYLRALNEFSSEPNKSCFVNQRVGVNWLRNILPELSQKSGCGVRYTNHSLRATAITRMFNSGVPEKLIAENSGHKSTKALRCYERTSSEQQKGVSKVIAKPGGVFKAQEALLLSSSWVSPHLRWNWRLLRLAVSPNLSLLLLILSLILCLEHSLTAPSTSPWSDYGIFLVLFSCFVHTFFD